MKTLKNGTIKFNAADIANANDDSAKLTHGGAHFLSVIAEMPCPVCDRGAFEVALTEPAVLVPAQEDKE